MSGPAPVPRRVTLGADAWAVLLAEATAVRLPEPFGVDDGPELTPAQYDAAAAALRASDAVTGDSGALISDLHPSLQASLMAQLAPDIVIDSRVGLGADARIARHVIQQGLGSALTREQRVTDDGAALGPVTWSTMLVDDVATDVVAALDAPDTPPAGETLELDPAVALATLQALRDGRPDVAAAVVEEETVPEPLLHAATQLDATARIDVRGRTRVGVLMAVCVDGGWWTATLGGGQLELRPVGRTDLVTDVAGLLAAEFLAEAALT